MEIAKRQACKSDYQWLYELKVAAMGGYIKQIFGWNAAVQKEFFDSDFRPNDITVITFDGLDAGMFELVKNTEGYFLKRIEILPSFQSKGVGSSIIREVLSRAAFKRENVYLMVFKINPAQKLYKRLGFEITKETETHYKMAYHYKNGH